MFLLVTPFLATVYLNPALLSLRKRMRGSSVLGVRSQIVPLHRLKLLLTFCRRQVGDDATLSSDLLITIDKCVHALTIQNVVVGHERKWDIELAG